MRTGGRPHEACGKNKVKGSNIAMKKPVPDDFGLTAEEYEKAIKEGFPILADFPLENVSEKEGYVLVFSIMGGAAIVGGLIGGIGGFILGLVLGFYVGGLIEGYVGDGKRGKKARERDERYRQAVELSRPLREKVQNYENAQRDYQLSLEKAQRERQRRREEYWQSLRGVEFEESLADLYFNLGYAVKTTKGSGDEGVDLFLEKDEKVIVVQCKGHGKPIGVGAIRDLYGAMIHFKADSAVLACPAGFTIGVERFATDKRIQPISATDLVEMAESVGNR